MFMAKTKKIPFPSLEENFLRLLKESKTAPLAIGALVKMFSGKGKFLFILILALPFCQPIQLPGLSIPFGISVLFFGVRIAFGKQIWLPKTILSKKIPSSILQKIGKNSIRIARKIRKWIHPRIDWACHHPVMHVSNGLVIALLGICLATPLPIPFFSFDYLVRPEKN